MVEARQPGLDLSGLRKSYGTFVAVDGFSLEIRGGELLALLGPSGCGKTTVLRLIAGLLRPERGTIRLGQSDITAVLPHRRNFGFVFQSYALFPHLTVAGNVAYGVRRRGAPRAEAERIVSRYLDLVRLPAMRDRYPAELSGGQQQRVALARALATEPKVLLLDEPLSNLDALLRDQMRIELRRLQQDLGITTVLVTHDQSEALTMADRICIMREGRIEQVGTGQEVYRAPRTAFVAQFIGRSNAFAGKVTGARGGEAVIAIAPGIAVIASPGMEAALGDSVQVTIRHNVVSLCAETVAAGPNVFGGRLVYAAMAGATAHFAVELTDARGSSVELIGEGPLASFPPGAAPGREVSVRVAPHDIIVTPETAA